MLTSASTGLALAALGLIWLAAKAMTAHDRREPPLILSGIPYITPAYEFCRKGSEYLVGLYKQHEHPIYTLHMPIARVYVLNKPALINSAQRQTNSVAFGPVGRDFGFRFSGLTKKSQDVIRNSGMFKENGDYDKEAGYAAIIHKSMGDPIQLERLTARTVEFLGYGVNDLAYSKIQCDLFDTVQHQMTLSLTDAVYGLKNPFRDPGVEAGWQSFLPGITKLTFGIFPSLVAREAANGRDRVVAAFERYFKDDGLMDASDMVRKTYDLALNYPLPPKEIAKMEIATCLALLSSGGITTYWLLFHIYSNPDILQACRNELSTLIDDSQLDLSQLQTHCSTLHAVLQETFRYHSTIISAKSVMESTSLGEHELKKGSLLMIPGPVVHHDATFWGADAHLFNHERFFEKGGQVGTHHLRPFGAGETMCPGRHFSTKIILAYAAMMVLQYDFTPVSGTWEMPTTKKAQLWNTMPKPDYDFAVTVSPLAKYGKQSSITFVWQKPCQAPCTDDFEDNEVAGFDEKPKEVPQLRRDSAIQRPSIWRNLNAKDTDKGFLRKEEEA